MCYKGWIDREHSKEYLDAIKEAEYLQEIELAKMEWNRALQQFHEVSEPEAVDFIIYYILAAEKRYMYLLNKYKELKSISKLEEITLSTNA